LGEETRGKNKSILKPWSVKPPQGSSFIPKQVKLIQKQADLSGKIRQSSQENSYNSKNFYTNPKKFYLPVEGNSDMMLSRNMKPAKKWRRFCAKRQQPGRRIVPRAGAWNLKSEGRRTPLFSVRSQDKKVCPAIKLGW
jgi:hypothetical protein